MHSPGGGRRTLRCRRYGDVGGEVVKVEMSGVSISIWSTLMARWGGCQMSVPGLEARDATRAPVVV